MKLVEDLFLSTADEKRTSPAVPMGDANTAMFELWVTSASGINNLDGVAAYLEGSNDGNYWATISGLDSTITIGIVVGFDTTNRPAYRAIAVTGSPVLVPYSQVRLRFELNAGGAATALVSASIRPWKA